MEKWLRKDTLKRKLTDTGNNNSNCKTYVLIGNQFDNLLLKLNQTVERKIKVRDIQVRIWNWDLHGTIRKVNLSLVL